MNVLRKRGVAVIITALVVLLSTVFSVNRSLGAAAGAVEDGFYTGAYHDGYIHKSVASQLRVRLDSAVGLMSVGDDYDGLSADVSRLDQARRRLMGLLDGEGGISDMYDANTELETAFSALYSALEGEAMTDRDRDSAALYKTNFDGAAKVIANSGYNESVRAFRRDELGQFPTALLAEISFVDSPELFE